MRAVVLHGIEDHPRVCGEKHRRFLAYVPREGSPPRVRGEAVDYVSNEECIRITPACAGRSKFLFQPCICSMDHPRVCGEKGY